MLSMQRIAVTLENVIKTAHFRSIFRKERLFQVTSVEVLLTSNYNCNVVGHLNVQRVPKKTWSIDVCRRYTEKLEKPSGCSSISGAKEIGNVSGRNPSSDVCRSWPSNKLQIGIIGGSGLDDMDILEEKCEKHVDTPFGKPSDVLVVGKIKNVNCVLLARHGRGHSIMPTNVNYQANIWALKNEGCTHIIAATACGSLKEDIQPGDIVIIDQFIDRTTKRHQTFYGGNPTNPVGVCHISMADPFCKRSREVLIDVVKKLGIKHHTKGTIVTIEGPRFSSRAESLMFRQWGGDVINMTTVPEVVLAKEAGISYVSIAMATDYDCWKESGDVVTVEMVLKVMKENANKALQIIIAAVAQIASMDWQESIKNLKASQEASVMLPPH
ncbi:S-methyl-5'-thioadenosine phosphorylase isoform X2 [Leucoraja erinacea]|uniref:S-methyl-5'-thioadenosine phosphorylase isoform X2 n=1 Tax=Leucoraja erinaceus TaxID=7782 RepID=UPI00245800AE|nr:S-methyl-5'-thioadenosine phosphorylase isoform X2 [Leucoraja erinacea]